MRGKRGVSPIIATVLLLVLTIVAVSILAVFVIPFVKDSLSGSKDCFDVLDQIKFDTSSAYNCYTSGTIANVPADRTGFSVRIDGNDIGSFSATLYRQGSAAAYSIESGQISSPNDIRMLGKDFSDTLDIPSNGGIRTYVAKGIYDRIEINPVLKSGKACKAEEKISMQMCAPDQPVIDKLLEH